jgi:hypothetical protein
MRLGFAANHCDLALSKFCGNKNLPGRDLLNPQVA